MSKILYVSSFAKDMYSVSGVKLINSFFKVKIDADLLICYENFDFNDDRVLSTDLGKNKFLLNWLEDNKATIPDYLGGTATKDNLRVWDPPNRKASRWFRKVASLHYAVEEYCNKYDYIVWIDADCVFEKKIENKMIDNILNEYDVFYHFGKKRLNVNKGFESGFIGFNMKNNGKNYLYKLFKSYETKEYLKFKRWDDGYLFRMIMEKNPKFKYNDVSKGSNSINVVLDGPFGKFITHNKGLHNNMKILV